MILRKRGLFVWGRGGDGQLGHGDLDDHPLPSLVRAMRGQRVVSIACGGKHSAIVTASGDVWTWGWNSSGQLGHGDLADHTAPSIVKSLALVKVLGKKKFVQAAAGNDHTVALTDSGAVYTWGGGDCGQLGNGSTSAQLVPRLVLALHSKKVVKVSCGSGHTVCLASDGAVFSWGKGANGRLGHGHPAQGSGPPEVVSTPHRIKGELAKCRVTDVTCGWSHSLCLTADGEAFSWGKGQDGQLGHGDESDVFEPRRVEFFSKAPATRIARIAGGYFHSAAISEDMKLFTWGYGEHGQLGHDGTANEHFPRFVERLATAEVVQVACGGAHTLVADSAGALYSFGSGGYGQLGLEPQVIEEAARKRAAPPAPHPMTPPLSASTKAGAVLPVPPTRVEHLAGMRVALIDCGYWHSIAFVDADPDAPAGCDDDDEPTPQAAPSATGQMDGHGTPPEQQQSQSSTPVKVSSPEATSSSGSEPGQSPSTMAVPERLGDLDVRVKSPAPAPAPSATDCSSQVRTRTVSAPSMGKLLLSPSPVSPVKEDHQQQQGVFTKLYELVAGPPRTESFSLKDEQKFEASELTWLNKVLPKWERARDSKKVRAMFREGVPPRIRGIVWSTVIGNRVGMTRELYAIYAKHARAEMSDFSGQGTARLIEVDLPRTFPHLLFFNSTGPFYQQLMEVLAAWAQYRPDVGYVQGMSHIAGMLVLHMETFDAFTAFINLLEDMFFLAFFKMDLDLIIRHLKVYDLIFSENMPELFAHFNHLEISPNYYLLDWFMTMFTHVLNIPVASRVWDCFLIEGEIFLHRTALGILLRHKSFFLANDFEKCVDFLRKLPRESITEQELMASILSIKVPSYLPSVLARLRLQFSHKARR